MECWIDIIRAGLGRRDAHPAPPQMAQQPGDDQGLAAARGRRGKDQPAPGHLPMPPSQSSAACRRTTSPMAMIVGPSILAAAASAAASAKVETRTRWSGVVALLTIA